MPYKIIKTSYKYCTENKLFFLFVLVLLFGCQYVMNRLDSIIVGPAIMTIIMMGYGLLVTKDVIDGGTRLPKIRPRTVIILGFKGFIVFAFYFFVQTLILICISTQLNFPKFEIKELILNYSNTMHLFNAHDPVSFSIFFISGIIVVYVTTFFMELSLARLADGGRVLNSFKFHRIKRAIDIIGWKSYFWDYTKIILSIVILTYLVRIKIPIVILDSVVDALLSFLIFIIQFIGIGAIYKVYVDNK